MNCAAYHLLLYWIREAITTICLLCHLDWTGTGKNREETCYLLASQAESGANATNLSPHSYNPVNLIAVAFINNVNKLTNFPHGPDLEVTFT